jgi:raffinose/stachyose/melibiose transport system permease protein
MYAILIFYSVLNLFPMFWIFISSFKKSTKIIVSPLGLPDTFYLVNYLNAWSKARFSMYFVNTVIAVGVTTACVLVIAGMAAYVVARVAPSLILYSYLSLGMMVPVHVLLIPNKIILLNLNLTNGRFGLILVYVAVFFSISFFITYGFMRTIPNELEESATVDGCSRTRTFFQIIMPIAKPGFATAGVMVLYQSWNEYLIPLCLVTNTNLKMLSQGLQDLKGQYTIDYGLVTAGIMLSVIPVIIIYTVFQKNIISGVTAGAVKG